MSQHQPFKSNYLNNFRVAEDKRENETLFPHCDQLSKLWQALDEEFRAGLPDRIKHTDHRASDFRKMQRHLAVNLFCSYINRKRIDKLRLFTVTDENLVARIAIVQQRVSLDPEKGKLHRFKFYAGEDFFREVFLHGRRLCFASHAIDRFFERVANHRGADLAEFLAMFFHSPIVVILTARKEGAVVIIHRNSAVFLPIRDSDTDREYFFPTCLNVNQVSEFELRLPPPAYTFHFSPEYSMPSRRNWNPIEIAARSYHFWKAKTPFAPPKHQFEGKSWPDIAHSVRKILEKDGHNEHSKIRYLDDIYGTNIFYLLPGQPELSLSEFEMIKPFTNAPDAALQKEIAEARAANPQWYS